MSCRRLMVRLLDTAIPKPSTTCQEVIVFLSIQRDGNHLTFFFTSITGGLSSEVLVSMPQCLWRRGMVFGTVSRWVAVAGLLSITTTIGAISLQREGSRFL